MGLDWHGGSLLATACGNGKIYVWNTVESNLVTVLHGHGSAAVSVVFNSSGRLLATTGWDNAVRIWDPLAGKELLTLPQPTERWGFRPDGHWFGWSGGQAQFGVLDPALECHQLRSEQQPDAAINSVSMSPDGRFLFAAQPPHLRVWDLREGKELCRLSERNYYNSFLAPDRQSLLTWSALGLERWPMEFGTSPRASARSAGAPARFGPEEDLWGLCTSADGQTLAFAHQIGDKNRIHVWDGASLTEKRVLTGWGGYWGIALSGDGHLCAASIRGETNVWVWDTASGILFKKIHAPGLPNLAFSPDNHWLVTGSGKEYLFWERVTWRCVRSIARTNSGGVRGFMAFSPDSGTLAMTDSRDSVRLVELATGRELARLEAPGQEGVNSLAFTPDGCHLVVASQMGAIHAWDLPRIHAQLASMKLDW
jgi:WD40 repeat protein